ncbi:MAG: MarR family transcriptional regulator [Psychrobacillus psychrodurans]
MPKEKIVSLNKALSKISGLYQKWFQQRQLNGYLMRAMTALHMENELSQKEISEGYQIPRQTVNNAVKALEKDGHVELFQDELDKRWKKIRFTETGRQFAEESLTPLIRLDEKILQRMGNEKYTQFISLLELYGELLEQEIKEDAKNK